jgi:hypothetical protein
VRSSLACAALLALVGCYSSNADKPIDPEDSDAVVVDSDFPIAPDETDDVDPVDDTAPYVIDADADGLYDHEDNCPEWVNPLQEDLDEDGLGDICDDDVDGDAVPDVADPWPRNDGWPGRVSPESIYPHTATELYRYQVNNSNVGLQGTFQFDQGGGNITDIAIDQYGVLYAITRDELFICRPDDGNCRYMADLPSFSIGLTFVPPGVLGPTDVLVGTGAEDWYRLDVVGTDVVSTSLGNFDALGTTASGDGFSLQGIGTFVSVNLHDDRDIDTIVQVSPATGAIQREVLAFDQFGSHSRVFGLAGWIDGYIYAFDESGDILRVSLQTGNYEVLHETGLPWWGAGVRTVVPLTP